MATDRILALLAFALFAVFLGIVGLSVKRIDLLTVLAIGIALAGYDLWRQLKPRRR
ncbi:hypothetical protein [Mesorhizobium sanjuanii]|nr:hypothetical protein [Mesorhizobium sanjuanii]